MSPLGKDRGREATCVQEAGRGSGKQDINIINARKEKMVVNFHI